MSRTEAQNKATYKYAKAHLKRVPLDLQIEDYEKIKAAAAACGESVNGYIKSKLGIVSRTNLPISRNESVIQDNKTNPNEFLFHPATTKAIIDGAKATGEDAEAFVKRAAETQAKRDAAALAIGINPAAKEEH